MKSKLHKYYHYVVRFARSPNKRIIFKELSGEVKEKGFLGGVRSLLHKKINLKGNYYQHDFSGSLIIRAFDKKTKVTLPHTTHPKVSVIIPMYNQLDYTMDCIYSIYKNTQISSYEIIVADDKSIADTSMLKDCFENIVVIRNETNLGFLKNCNNAALQARGEYIVMLNNDTQVQEKWLEELIVVFDNFDNVGLVGSKLVYPDGKLQEAGGIIWQDGSGWNYGNQDNPYKPEYNYVKETDYISGASIMIPRKLWLEAGGFDELFAPAYCEDSDLCFRIRKMGYKVMYQPFSVAVHFEGVTHGKNVNKGVKQYQVINQQKFMDRWKAELQLKSKNGENVYGERDRTTGKKHVLVVDHYLPTIDKDAGSRTISNFIDVLIDLDYSVKFLGENQNSSPHYQEYFQGKGVEVLYGHEFNFYDHSWKNYVREHLADIDAFLLSRSSVCTPVLSFLRNCDYKGVIIYYGHDLGFKRLELDARLKNDNSIAAQATNLKAQEDYMYQHVDAALVISREETDYLKQYIKTPLHYVPPYFFNVPAAIPSYESREGLLFVGGFNHPPNKEAALWLLNDIYPALHEAGIPLTIAGSLMPREIFKYMDRYSLLKVYTDVPSEELEAMYAQARIAVVPLLSGAGVKGKVIEAMAKGVPVVGTDIAFEGMPKDDTFFYKGANTPTDLANEVLRVYNSKNAWQQCADFGCRYVRDNYNRDGMKKVFKGLIG